MITTTSTENDSTAGHVHRRDRYCPAMFPPPITPRKPAAIFLFGWASAIARESTFLEFVRQHPDEFPTVTSADPADVSIVMTVDR